MFRNLIPRLAEHYRVVAPDLPGFGFSLVSDIPFQEILDRVAHGVYQAKPARTFIFDEIRDAHRLMESNEANGKLVVKVASG
jgi:pimeloyl-ACP methyl ester carboxylesterase